MNPDDRTWEGIYLVQDGNGWGLAEVHEWTEEFSEEELDGAEPPLGAWYVDARYEDGSDAEGGVIGYRAGDTMADLFKALGYIRGIRIEFKTDRCRRDTEAWIATGEGSVPLEGAYDYFLKTNRVPGECRCRPRRGPGAYP